jgi:nicotinate-nucleotide adenylyltransferase
MASSFNTEPQAITRLGMLGGAFDPPHRAHFALAQAAIDQLELDQLRIIPTGNAWHKARTLSAAEHRVAMCELGFAGLNRTVIDARETLRAGATYTFDTLSELRAEFPVAQLFLVLGEDQARAFTTWHCWEAIVDLAIICVAARADESGASGAFSTQTAPIPPFKRLELPLSALSATDIRKRVASHKSVSPLVFDSVARYIEQHHLYLTT